VSADRDYPVSNAAFDLITSHSPVVKLILECNYLAQKSQGAEDKERMCALHQHQNSLEEILLQQKVFDVITVVFHAESIQLLNILTFHDIAVGVDLLSEIVLLIEPHLLLFLHLPLIPTKPATATDDGQATLR